MTPRKPGDKARKTKDRPPSSTKNKQARPNKRKNVTVEIKVVEKDNKSVQFAGTSSEYEARKSKENGFSLDGRRESWYNDCPCLINSSRNLEKDRKPSVNVSVQIEKERGRKYGGNRSGIFGDWKKLERELRREMEMSTGCPYRPKYAYFEKTNSIE